jgi:hypothetical protein
MADYKLKLEIDASELEKQIKQALKKSMGGFSGAGGGGGFAGSQAGSVNQQILDAQEKFKKAVINELYDRKEIMAKMKREHMKEYKELSARNTRLRQQGVNESRSFRNIGQLLGGRMGGAAGSVFDLISTKTGFMKDKDGKERKGLPQAVKLAGIAAGIAGAAGFGKMIIDSSPVLKAMLKLLNVGIMLILRPIGDFIGFMLRPMLIEFVKKVAIPAYRQGAQLAKTWGTKFGEALVNFFADPIGTIVTAIQMGTAGVVSEAADGIGQAIGDFFLPQAFGDEDGETTLTPYQQLMQDLANAELEKLDEIKQEITKVDTSMDEALKDIYPWTQEKGKTAEEIAKEKMVEDAKKQAADALAAQEENFNQARADEEKRIEEELAKEKAKTEEDKMKKIAEELKNAPKIFLSDAARAILGRYDAYKSGSAAEGATAQAGGRGSKEFGTMYDPIKSADMGNWIGTGEFDECGNEFEKFQNFAADSRMHAETYTEALRCVAAHGGCVTDVYAELLAIENQKLAMKATEKGAAAAVLAYTKDIEGNWKLTTEYSENITKIQESAMNWIAGKLRRIASYRTERGSKPAFARTAAAAANVNSIYGSGGGGSIPRAKYQYTLGNGVTKEVFMNDSTADVFRNKYASGGLVNGHPLVSFRKMASGGLITEPIMGIGQNTGRGYLMGEAGPERITPGTGQAGGTGGGNTFNITINASGVGDIERQLKPAILKMIKESTSRAGIV